MQPSLVKIVANFETTLATNVNASATTATLTSNTDKNGNTLLDGKFGFSISIGKSNLEHIVCTKTGTALTDIKTINLQTGAETAGFAKSHEAGETVAITNYVVLKRALDLLNGATAFDADIPLKYDGDVVHTADKNEFATVQDVEDNTALFLKRDGTNAMTANLNAGTNKIVNVVNPTSNQDVATKKYVDDTAVAGSPNASETVKGIVEEATQAEMNAGTDTGTTGARLFVPPSKIQSYVSSVAGGIETGSFTLSNTGTTVITHSLGRAPKKITFFTGFRKVGTGSASIFQFNSHGIATYNGTSITNIVQAVVGDQSGSFRNAINDATKCIHVDAADISPTTSRSGTASVTGVTSTNVTVTNSFTGTLAITVNYIIE